MDNPTIAEQLEERRRRLAKEATRLRRFQVAYFVLVVPACFSAFMVARYFWDAGGLPGVLERITELRGRQDAIERRQGEQGEQVTRISSNLDEARSRTQEELGALSSRVEDVTHAVAEVSEERPLAWRGEFISELAALGTKVDAVESEQERLEERVESIGGRIPSDAQITQVVAEVLDSRLGDEGDTEEKFALVDARDTTEIPSLGIQLRVGAVRGGTVSVTVLSPSGEPGAPIVVSVGGGGGSEPSPVYAVRTPTWFPVDSPSGPYRARIVSAVDRGAAKWILLMEFKPVERSRHSGGG